MSGEPDGTAKRPRPVLSCLECRRKKLKCDRLLPCQQCQKSGKATLCAYSNGIEPDVREEEEEEDSAPLPKRVRSNEQPDNAGNSLAHSATLKRVGILEELQDRILKLEEEAEVRRAADDACSPVRGSQPSDTISKSTTRYHAEGQRMNLLGKFDEAASFILKIQSGNSDPEIVTIANDLRSLYMTIKPPSELSYQGPLSADTIRAKLIEMIPIQSVSDKLVALYFDNYENCLRVLHRTTFMEEYHRFWDSWRQLGSPKFTVLVPTLVLVLSVASSLNTSPECSQIALGGSPHMPSALHLTEKWVDSLSHKDKYSIPTLQVRVLALLPQHGRSSRIEDLWNTAGQIVRHAMAMGLCRDSGAKLSVFEAEQRRRLWMTIVEGDLTMSLMCGMPPMLSPDDFTCQIPATINDSELYADMVELPKQRPTTEWTDTICQHVLSSTLSLRLSAYRYMCSAKTEFNYEEVLKFTRRLETVLQELPVLLRPIHVSDDATNSPGRLFARMNLDLLLRRILLNLYTPFAFAISAKDVFKEARISYLRSCLVLVCYQDHYDPKFSELEAQEQQGYWDTFYKIYKHDIVQTCLGLCIEIKRLSDLPIPSSTRPNILINESRKHHENESHLDKFQTWTKTSMIKAVEDTIEAMVRRISRPGSDAKDLLCFVAVLHSVRTNQSPVEKERLIKEGVTELILSCQRQLQRHGLEIPSPAPETGSSSYDGILSNQFDFSGLFDMTDFNFAAGAFPNTSTYHGLDTYNHGYPG